MEKINDNDIGANTATNDLDNGLKNDDTISMTKVDFDKKIQSETDKIRTKYSEKIKALELKIKELTPPEKSETELDIERRLAEIEAREKAMNLNDALLKKGINSEFGKYLRDDVDVDALSILIDNIAADKLKSNSFIPNGHKSGESMTKEQFRKLSMDERERIYLENRELFMTLAGR